MPRLVTPAEHLWHVAANGLAPSVLLPRRLRWRLLRALGLDLDGPRLAARGFYGSRDISIGRGSYLNQEVFLDGSAPVRIGRDCHLAMRVSVITSSHAVGPAGRRGGPAEHAPVTIGDGCWIGAAATILPGVTVGEGVVVAAGAVVSSDCAPHGVYAGVPARRVRELDPR